MPTRRRKSSRKKKTDSRDSYLNSAIVILSIICIGFIFSIIQRNLRDGAQLAQSTPGISLPKLITTSYEESPLSSIEVEILNGCGVKGIAQQLTEYLRSHHLDVVSTENADNFDYPTTHIIQRSQFIESSYRVAELLNIPKNDTTRILLQPDLSLSVDVTLIIGNDYNKIKSFRKFLKTQP